MSQTLSPPPPAAPRPAPRSHRAPTSPWPALWAMVVGFFMILIDSTIVSVATPAIMVGLQAGISQVIWVTSSYLLAYAVPLLITGRLGDRFGPKNVYLVGLVVFTLSSLWCGFSDSVSTLILARAVQGLGAALMTPQTMAVITRTFPPQRRGAAMGLWGSVAGFAILVGPILGGVLVDSAGWEWIFFVNVPVGVAAFIAAAVLVPKLETHSHTFDWLGVLLSAAAMFLIVFGIQEGESYDWGAIWGPITVWQLILAGVIVLAGFVYWQHANRREPLLPLSLFRDRNFSLSNLAIAAMGFVVTGMAFPMMLYAQTARGLTSTHAALLMTPMAVITGALAPIVGRLIDRFDPKWFAASGFTLFGVSLLMYWWLMDPQYSILWLLVPAGVMGVASAGIWSPLSVSATRNLGPREAGAGAGVYNTTRQVGSVLGSAAIAALMTSRLTAQIPQFAGSEAMARANGSATLPEALVAPFSTAMAQTVLMPAAVVVVGVVCALLFGKPVNPEHHESDA